MTDGANLGDEPSPTEASGAGAMTPPEWLTSCPQNRPADLAECTLADGHDGPHAFTEQSSQGRMRSGPPAGGDLPAEAVEAARHAAREALHAIPGSNYTYPESTARTIAEAVLAAAVPLIRAHVAHQIADEMLAVNTRYIRGEVAATGYVGGLAAAARVAQGATDA